jgi:hypothetical protein
MGHAFDLQAWFAEIKQQAEVQTGRLQIIGALHPTPGSSARGHVRRATALKAIGSVPAVSLGPCKKGFNAKVAKIAKQVIECASREAPYSCPKRVEYSEPAANNLPRQFIQHGVICVFCVNRLSYLR